MKQIGLVAALLTVSWYVGRLSSAAGPVAAEEPLYVLAHVDVMPNFTEAGRGLLRQFAAECRKLPGAVRVEVYEELSRPNHSTVVEVWESRKAYDDHLASDVSKTYRGKLQPMLGSPFDERLHRFSQ